MYLIVMDARTSEVLLSTFTSQERLSAERQATRKQLEFLFPARTILSPLERMKLVPLGEPVHVLTVYKSRFADGRSRAAVSAAETWLAVNEQSRD